MQTRRYHIGGDTGRGKSTTGQALVSYMAAEGKLGRLVVLSTEPAYDLQHRPNAWRRMCDAAVILDDDKAERGIDWASALDRAPRLYVEQAATDYPANTIGALAGELYARGYATFVADEAHETVPSTADKRLVRLWIAGRKRAIDCISITAAIMDRNGAAMHPAVLDHSDVRILFRASSAVVAAKLADKNHPRLAEALASLQGPEGGAPHFVVHRADSIRAELVTPTRSRWLPA